MPRPRHQFVLHLLLCASLCTSSALPGLVAVESFDARSAALSVVRAPAGCAAGASASASVWRCGDARSSLDRLIDAEASPSCAAASAVLLLLRRIRARACGFVLWIEVHEEKISKDERRRSQMTEGLSGQVPVRASNGAARDRWPVPRGLCADGAMCRWGLAWMISCADVSMGVWH